MLKDIGEGKINDETCALGYMDGNFSVNLNIVLAEGEAPKNDHEIMLEKWYLDQLALHIGDTINIALSNGTADDYVISGVIND